MICPTKQPDPRLTQFLRDVYVSARLGISPSAAEQIGYAIRSLERWHGDPLRISQLSEPLLRGFLSDYCREHSASTANSKRGHLLALWQCAWEEGYRDQPPRRSKVRVLRTERAVPEAWTPAEVARILVTCNGEQGRLDGILAACWWRSLLLVAYDTGERRGALLKTMLADLDCDRAVVLFRATKTRQHRLCALSPDTVEACRRILAPQRPLLWPWPHHRSYLDKSLRRILRRAGVPYGRDRGGVWHKFRRTSGSLVEAAGGDGAKHLGNTRAVFEQSYRDPRFFHSSVELLPRPG